MTEPLDPEARRSATRCLPEQVSGLADRFFTTPTEKQLGLHEKLKAKYPTVRPSGRDWLRIVVWSTILGFSAYAVVVTYCYNDAFTKFLTTRAQFADSWPTAITSKQAASITLDTFGLSPDSNTESKLADAIEASRASDPGPDKSKPIVLDVVEKLLAKNIGACGTCASTCNAGIKPTLARMLLGWPMSASKRAADVKYLHDTFGGPPPGPSKAGAAQTAEQLDQAQLLACQRVDAQSKVSAFRFSTVMMTGREEPWSAPAVAHLVVGDDKCQASATDQGARDLCQIVTRFFQTAIDDRDVKAARANWVDFFYGWERTLVFILAFVVAMVLWRQSSGRRRLDVEAAWVREKINAPDLAAGLDPTDESSTIDPLCAALALKHAFTQAFRPTFEANAQEPIAEMVAAIAEAVQRRDLDYFKTFVDRNLTELEASRELNNGIITIFPVIGFSATLLSLVDALAGANQIATSNGDMRSASILTITSLLSSCFATTFLALICMSLFAVLNLLSGGQEQRVITILSERLITKFRIR